MIHVRHTRRIRLYAASCYSKSCMFLDSLRATAAQVTPQGSVLNSTGGLTCRSQPTAPEPRLLRSRTHGEPLPQRLTLSRALHAEPGPASSERCASGPRGTCIRRPLDHLSAAFRCLRGEELSSVRPQQLPRHAHRSEEMNGPHTSSCSKSYFRRPVCSKIHPRATKSSLTPPSRPPQRHNSWRISFEMPPGPSQPVARQFSYRIQALKRQLSPSKARCSVKTPPVVHEFALTSRRPQKKSI